MAYRKEERYFVRLVRDGAKRKLLTTLRVGVEFRHYLAERDIFAWKDAKKPNQRAGLRAAQTMWRQIRDPKIRGPIEQIVIADANR